MHLHNVNSRCGYIASESILVRVLGSVLDFTVRTYAVDKRAGRVYIVYHFIRYSSRMKILVELGSFGLMLRF